MFAQASLLRTSLRALLTLAAIWPLAGCTAPASGPAAPSSASSMPAATAPSLPARDSRFLFEGRFDPSLPAGPVVVWQGSRIALDFTGDALALHFADAQGQNFFNAEIDGHNTIVAVPAGHVAPISVPVPAVTAGHARHTLRLFKRSEAAAGTVRFLGVTLAPGAAAFAPAAPDYALRLQFIGDSITVGACNEDGDTDQWDDRRTHNHALSWATLTSQAFHADHRATAVSGMGVSLGWVEPTAGQVWDRVYPVATSPRADLTAWTPDVVCVNLGENDSSFTAANNRPFPSADYTARYVALIRAVLAAYPQAHVVLLRGGMHGGKHHDGLRAAWTAAVAELEAHDPAVSHFVFAHWSANHPRVADDRAMAAELIAWLRAQPFMARFAR